MFNILPSWMAKKSVIASILSLLFIPFVFAFTLDSNDFDGRIYVDELLVLNIDIETNFIDDMTIEWGDGSTTSYTDSEEVDVGDFGDFIRVGASHDYASAGIYTVTVTVTADGGLETDQLVVEVADYPDLIVSEAWYDNGLYYTIENIGAGEVYFEPGFDYSDLITYVEVLDEDANEGYADENNSFADASSEVLLANGSTEVLLENTSSWADGIYNVLICADVDNIIPELEDTDASNCYEIQLLVNNGASQQAGDVDSNFIISDVSLSESLYGSVSYTIENEGSEAVQFLGTYTDADLGVTLEVTYPDGSVLSFEDTPSTTDISFLGAESSSTIAALTFADVGVYLVTACVDQNVVNETNYDDNCSNFELELPAYTFRIDVGEDMTIFEGGDADVLATIYDVNASATSIDLTVDWDNGDADAYTETSPTSSFEWNVTYNYVDAGTYTVEVCAHERASVSVCDTLIVEVVSADGYILDMGDDQTVNEGETVTIAPILLSVNELSPSTELVVNWGDGTVETYSNGALASANRMLFFTLQHTYPLVDEDTEFMVSGEVTHDGDVFSDEMIVTVLNVEDDEDSELRVDAGEDRQVFVGELLSLSVEVTGFDAAASTLDTQISWGDSIYNTFQTSLGGEESVSLSGVHAYSLEGAYVIEVCADDGQTQACDLVDVQVLPEDAYIFDLGDNQTLEDGEELEIRGILQSLTGSLDNVYFDVDWGDGSAVFSTFNGHYDVLSEQGRLTLVANHIYRSVNSTTVYDVVVYARELEGDTSYIQDSIAVTVHPPVSSVGDNNTGTNGSSSSGGGGGGAGGLRDNVSNPSINLASDDFVETCKGMNFADVTEHHVWYNRILFLWCNDVIHGRSDTIFAPNEPVLRSEVVKIIARLFGFVTLDDDHLPAVTERPFKDVAIALSTAYYIQEMKQSGFIYGFHDDSFLPSRPMRLSEVESFLSRAFGEPVNLSGPDKAEFSRGRFADLILQFYEEYSS